MAGRLMIILAVPVVLGMLLTGLIRLLRTVRTDGQARAARARSLAASVATSVAGFAATWLWLTWGKTPAEDIRLATLPALACTVAVLTAAVAERTWPQPVGQVRVANLSARQPDRQSALRRLFVVGVVSTCTALFVGALTAGADGRSFSRHSGDTIATGSPYPGLSYGWAVGAATALLVAATWFAHRQVEGRPGLGPGAEELDQSLRRASHLRVLRPAAAGALVTAAGLWITMGATVNTVTQNLRMNLAPALPQLPTDWVQNVGFVAITTGVVMVFLAVVAMVWSSAAPRRDSHTLARTTGPAQAGV